MLKLSNKEKQLLLYLITNCEIYQLTESEALKYIKDKFSKLISRRTYYNYKNQVYEEHDKNTPFFGLLRFHESKQKSKDMASILPISHRESIIRDGLINGNITSRNEFYRLDDPELSPTFSKKDGELNEILGIITLVLDGHGYESDTGAQGHRGYNGEFMFVWIGAAVDIPKKVHKLLDTLGPKLYFFRIKSQKKDEEFYLKQIQNENID